MSIENRKSLIEFPPLLDPLFESVQQGLKTLELRKEQPPFTNVKVADSVILKSRKSEQVKVEIIAIRKYKSLDEVLKNENVEKLAPNTTEEQRRDFAQRMFPDPNVPLLLFEFKKVG
ncbi:hypothetical protein A3G98_00265 [Candidatus Nomurabacteria bacterium RIFCSPLOWO2_12_FULL_37_8]|uniref:ASCH domain-containing protein n=1 Tax=Candidatus Nomurabacteria bacterium RIFCSPLOWO2_12_FULL_37_8 TaxID=1801793 RepID=A0A1F6Y5B1_9BACT|nr:MAG: hypothetical protein A3G98_00265 [Candidatus Nomurabacteria bacterium RIFCSPLOWO2_12_FULL_37_8]